MSLSLVVGIGILAFLYLYFAFSLDQSHFLLKFLLIFFFIFSAILIPKATLVDDCSLELANSTIAGAVTTYEYNTFCKAQTETKLTFLNIPYWFFRLFVIYFSVYLFYHWAKKSELWGKMWK